MKVTVFSQSVVIVILAKVERQHCNPVTPLRKRFCDIENRDLAAIVQREWDLW